jgi:hypothetical protein
MHPLGDVHEVISGISVEICLAWPFSPADLIEIDSDTDTTKTTALLERKALDLENWSADPSVVSRYPFLAGCVQVKAAEA